MAQRSGFFNAILSGGVYDRTYSADDYCDNLAVIISNGVLRSNNDDLKVTANGLNLTVNIGRAWIKGHYFNNTTNYTLPAISAPSGGSRIDNVVLRFDNTITGRQISIEYVQGTAATSPVAPALTRTDAIYELCIAQISIAANANTVTVTDTRGNSSLCGWVYSVSGDGSFFTSLDNSFTSWFNEVRNTLASVTLFKQYKWTYTLLAASSTVQFNIPQYDEETCFFDVFINGLLTNDYTANGDILSFSTVLDAGTDITVLAYKSIDSTGIMSVADEITELQNQYATISGVSKFTYNATGSNDNISLSQIAQAFYSGSYTPSSVTTAASNFLTALGGNTYLGNLADDAKITIEVVGTLGVSTPAYGSGASGYRYRWFNLGQTSTKAKRIIFDFAKSDMINISCGDNAGHIIFYGTDLEIKNVSATATNSGEGCDIQMVANSNYGRISVENCNFKIQTSGDAKIAENGTFINCYCWASSSAGHSLLFVPNSNELIRIIGGTFFAYAQTGGKTAAIFYTYATETNAIIIAENISCPTVTVTGYWQQYLAVGYAGKTMINYVVSTMNSAGNYNTITNQIWQSKA